MKCPWCGHRHSLSWSAYFRHPNALFQCPSCRRRFQLARSTGYIRLLTYGALLSVAQPLAVTYLMLDSLIPAVIVGLAGALFFLLPFDRYLEDRIRESRKVGEDKVGSIGSPDRPRHVGPG